MVRPGSICFTCDGVDDGTRGCVAAHIVKDLLADMGMPAIRSAMMAKSLTLTVA